MVVLEQGIIEGRKAFANTVKYIRLGAKSDFGNMFNVPGASAFLSQGRTAQAWLPMTRRWERARSSPLQTAKGGKLSLRPVRALGGTSPGSYTFPWGCAPSPPDGREFGKSRRAAPIRLSAIP